MRTNKKNINFPKIKKKSTERRGKKNEGGFLILFTKKKLVILVRCVRMKINYNKSKEEESEKEKRRRRRSIPAIGVEGVANINIHSPIGTDQELAGGLLDSNYGGR